MSNRTDPGLSVSEDTRLKMPLKTLVAIIVFVAAAAASWGSIRFSLSKNTEDIGALKADVKEIQTAQRQQGDLLIRIDTKLDSK
jgi:hypothetical protein